MLNDYAKELRCLWNDLLLNQKVEVCTDKLKGCSMLELKILKIIYFQPEFKIKDYLNKLHIPNSTFTNAINRLVKKELVIRKITESDLRSFELELTGDGKVAVSEHLQAETEIFEKLLSNLNEDEKKEILRLFRKIII